MLFRNDPHPPFSSLLKGISSLAPQTESVTPPTHTPTSLSRQTHNLGLLHSGLFTMIDSHPSAPFSPPTPPPSSPIASLSSIKT